MVLAAVVPLLVFSASLLAVRATVWPETEWERCTFPVGDPSRLDGDYDDYAWLSCPPSCFSILLDPPPSPLPPSDSPPLRNGSVWGSFPYDADSSACLAAIHSGIIDEALGGIIAMYAVYPFTWFNDSTQTIFPHGSHLGSLSNGVQSLEVPRHRYHVPSVGEELSWSVAGRGLLFKQKRTAPFAPRSNHLHFHTYQPGPLYVKWETHWIVGGRNATHWFNDVWMCHRCMLGDGYPRWGTWRKMDDAPFTPRSDMRLSKLRVGTGDLYWDNVYLVGGQTADACGLQELGVCVNEVWVMSIVSSGPGVDDVRVEWTTRDRPDSVLPFAPRCDAALLTRYDNAGDYIVITSGQASYNDSTCTQQPEYLNDAWYSPHAMGSEAWRRGADAPFLPRRGLERTLSFDISYIITGLSVPSSIGMTLAGGVQYTHRYNHTTQRSRLTSALIFSDTWACNRQDLGLDGAVSAPDAVECAFGYPTEGGQRMPVGSVPVGRVRGAEGAYYYLALADFYSGGAVSEASARRWQSTRPLLDRDVVGEADWSQVRYNVTLMLRQFSIREGIAGAMDWPTYQQLLDDRFGHPWWDLVEEEELNDPNGSFTLGSDWVHPSGHTSLRGGIGVQSSYQQRLAFPETPEESTAWVYQAKSSRNTTRGRFNFDHRRLDFATESASLSGGRSGLQYSAELQFHNVYAFWCLPPNDTSFRDLLGPVRITGDWMAKDWKYSSDRIWGAPQERRTFYGGYLQVECLNSSFHWEPPSREPQLVLFCLSSGVWMDFYSQTIRRCVRQKLSCPPPLVDEGLDSCQFPPPTISSLSMDDYPGIVSVNPVTLAALPVMQTDMRLKVRGSYFTQPLLVSVGGFDCLEAELMHDDSYVTVCRNTSQAEVQDCQVFADTLTCNAPAVFGQKLPVRVRVGTYAVDARVSDELRETGYEGLATVSSTQPVILSINSSACVAEPLSPLQLLACPVTHPFNVTVRVDATSTLVDDSIVQLDDAHRLECRVDDQGWLDKCPEFGVCPVDFQCRVYPHFGVRLLRVASSEYQGLTSREPVSLSFQQCSAGHRNDYTAAMTVNATDLCIQCPPGASTMNATNQPSCKDCLVGSYADRPGMPACLPCPRGSYAAEPNSTTCLPCSLNSWQHAEGQGRCDVCDLGTYIRYTQQPSAADSGAGPPRIEATCEPCPFLAKCDANGTVDALRGAYVLIEQQAHTARSVPCSSSACVGFKSQQRVSTSPDIIPTSELPVMNWCGVNRMSAYDPNAPALAHTGGHNVLCAACKEGYTQVNGVCEACEAIAWGGLLGGVCVSLLLVYALHRLPHDFSGSGRLMIVAYFAQLALLFLASQWMPPIMGVINVSLLASHHPYGTNTDGWNDDDHLRVAGCIAPLSDYGLMGMQLLSPLLAVLLLAVIVGVQWLTSRLLKLLRAHPLAHHVYRWLFVFGEERAEAGSQSGLSSRLLDAPAHEVEHISTSSSFSSSSGPLLLYQRTLVRLAQLAYTSIALTCLSFFQLQEVGAFGHRVVDYSQMDPASAAYIRMQPVVIALIVFFVCGLPFAMFSLLWFHRRRGTLKAVDSLSPAAPITHLDAAVVQLVSAFRGEVWWYSVFVLVRRLLLAGVLVAVRDSSVWVWLTFINYCVLAAHCHLRPYKRRADNQLELLCLLSLSVQTTLLSLWPPPIASSALLAVLLISVFIPALAVLLAVAAPCALRMRQRRRVAAPELDKEERGEEEKVQSDRDSMRELPFLRRGEMGKEDEDDSGLSTRSPRHSRSTPLIFRDVVARS